MRRATCRRRSRSSLGRRTVSVLPISENCNTPLQAASTSTLHLRLLGIHRRLCCGVHRQHPVGQVLGTRSGAAKCRSGTQ
jgi:hypothetical protein